MLTPMTSQRWLSYRHAVYKSSSESLETSQIRNDIHRKIWPFIYIFIVPSTISLSFPVSHILFLFRCESLPGFKGVEILIYCTVNLRLKCINCPQLFSTFLHNILMVSWSSHPYFFFFSCFVEWVFFFSLSYTYYLFSIIWYSLHTSEMVSRQWSSLLNHKIPL